MMAALALSTGLAIAPWDPAEAQAPCYETVAVPDSTNSGLVGDCNTLLSLMGTLTSSADLKWSEETAISDWNGIAVSGSPLRVTGLNLDDSDLNGSIPSGLGDLSNLSTLDLSDNQLTGSIPSELGKLSNLTTLNLSGNGIIGSIPFGLGDLSSLSTLDLSHNQLTGSIPSELGKLTSLRTLDLSHNQLTGSIPSELGDLSNLSTLDLSDNQLTGSIASELGKLTSLRTLDLSSNQITGAIPSELGGLSSLSTLNLSDNGLTGSIPSKLGNLSSLTQLDLSINKLAWEIPEELNRLDNLDSVSLNDNFGLIGPAHLNFANLSDASLWHMETETWAVADFSSATTWSLSGADSRKFGITSDGVLTFISAPDYEDPSSAGSSNNYSVVVTASVGGTPKSAGISVHVTDRDIALSVSPGSFFEEGQSTQFDVTATLDGGTTRATSTDVTLSLAGSASGDDYEITTLNTITIPANSASATTTLTLDPDNDEIVEGDEVVKVVGVSGDEAISSAWITIQDEDEGKLSLSGPGAPVAEGPDTAFTFTVTLSHAIGPEVTVEWSVIPGSATATDYGPSSGSVTFAEGFAATTTKSFTITPRDDDLSEGDESFTVRLGAVSGDISDRMSVDLSASSAAATILENDQITVIISGPSSVDEGESVIYTVNLSPNGVTPTADLTVHYATADDTAGSDDYEGVSETLTFTSSDAETVTMQITEDSIAEDSETFSFYLSGVSGGGGPTPLLGNPSSITTTIIDDDGRHNQLPPANDAPTFNEGATTTRAALENSKVGTEVGEPVRATDSDGDQLEYWLPETDRVSFHLDSRTGQLTTALLLDYETQSDYSVRVRVRDGEGGSDGIDVTITVVDLDEAPSQPGAPEARSTGPTGLAVSWSAPDNQGPEITNYDVRYREAGGEFQDAEFVGADTSITLNNLKPGTSYEAQVRAVNAEGASPWSESGRGETEEAPRTPAPTISSETTPTPTLTTVPPVTPTSTPEPTVAPTSTAEPTATSTPATAFTSGPNGTPAPRPTLLPVTTPTTEPSADPTLAPKPTRTPVPGSTDAIALAPTVEPVPLEGDVGDRGFPWWVIVGGVAVVILVVTGVVLIVGGRRSRR